MKERVEDEYEEVKRVRVRVRVRVRMHWDEGWKMSMKR